MERVRSTKVVRRSQVSAEESNIPIHDALENYLAVSRAELSADLKFRSARDGGDGALGLAAWTVCFHGSIAKFCSENFGKVRTRVDHRSQSVQGTSIPR